MTSPREALISNASPLPGHSPLQTSVALTRSAVVGFLVFALHPAVGGHHRDAGSN
ncbi:MAG: hypothetical protein OXC98_13105 [bacterium]|nr:hypothetical protein [Acidimicrobiia bacterium]MCY4651279.1 hypothetical protein [bacterium]